MKQEALKSLYRSPGPMALTQSNRHLCYYVPCWRPSRIGHRIARQFWKGVIQGPLVPSLIPIGQILSDDKIFECGFQQV